MTGRSKEDLTRVAEETVAIVKAGFYDLPGGGTVNLLRTVGEAMVGTRLYGPGSVPAPRPVPGGGPPRFEVSGETTGAAAMRITEAGTPVVALNFASAKNPGGGFLRGTKAQEEDLARCSALHACLSKAPGYYEANRACGDPLYTDHVVYSPEVPFFRDEHLRLLRHPYPLSVITAPAPNAGESNAPREEVLGVLARRAGIVLDLAAHLAHRTLLLGAWGCGVFRNDPDDVAQTFFGLLRGPRYAGLFDLVCFAVYDPPPGRGNLTAFLRALDG